MGNLLTMPLPQPFEETLQLTPQELPKLYYFVEGKAFRNGRMSYAVTTVNNLMIRVPYGWNSPPDVEYLSGDVDVSTYLGLVALLRKLREEKLMVPIYCSSQMAIDWIDTMVEFEHLMPENRYIDDTTLRLLRQHISLSIQPMVAVC